MKGIAPSRDQSHRVAVRERAAGGAIPLSLLDITQVSHARDTEMLDRYTFSTLCESRIEHVTVDGGDGRRRLGGCVGSVASFLPRTRIAFEIEGGSRALAVSAPRGAVEEALAAAGITEAEPLRHLHTADLFEPAMDRAIRAIWDEAGRGGAAVRLAVDGLFAQLLVHALQLGRADPLIRPPPLGTGEVARVAALVHDRIGDAPGLGELASEIGYPPLHFARAFEAATGETPYRFAMRLTIVRVRELLETDATVADIARACGFASRAQLVETFRQQAGLTPTAYRIGLLT